MNVSRCFWRVVILHGCGIAAFSGLAAGADEPAKPVFRNGEAQVVPAFEKSADWVRHDLWVETDFDSDGNGKPDRMHVDVTRQKQTDTEGLKVPVVYESSPYYAGTGTNEPQFFWSPRQELGVSPPKHITPEPIAQQSLRPVISDSQVNTWVPRGFAVVHSSSPGTGLSQGCPTIGGDNESLAPKAVIDWLNGRAKRSGERLLVHGQSGHDGDVIQRHDSAGRCNHWRGGIGSHHSRRSEHVVLSLLSVAWTDSSSGRLHG